MLFRAASERRHISFEPRGLPPRRVHGRKTMTSHLMPTFARVHLAFERGEGVWLVATDGERYLDFTSGVAVNALGHAHPHLVAALTAQAQKLWHVSNLYEIPEAEHVAERLCAASFADVVCWLPRSPECPTRRVQVDSLQLNIESRHCQCPARETPSPATSNPTAQRDAGILG